VAAAAVVTAGCDLDPRTSRPAQPAPTSGAPTDPGEDADRVLLEDLRVLLLGVSGLVATTRDTFQDLRRPLAPLAALHGAHLAVLDGSGGSDNPTGRPRPLPELRASEALARVRVREARLGSRLADGSVRVGSGEFARLLASMSAGVAAHLADLLAGP